MNKSMKKKPRKARGVRFSEDTWGKLQKEAKDHEVTPSDVVRCAVKDYFQAQEHQQTGL